MHQLGVFTIRGNIIGKEYKVCSIIRRYNHHITSHYSVQLGAYAMTKKIQKFIGAIRNKNKSSNSKVICGTPIDIKCRHTHTHTLASSDH